MNAFMKLVEIQTKLASQLPLLLGTSYVLYAYDQFKPLNFLYLFLSLLSFDMATTAINNYFDYKKAIKTSGYGYETHNAIVSFNMSERKVGAIILILLLMATGFGIMLFVNTSIVVLLLGLFSFGIGILYSYGPVPISRTPFGEFFSGSVMGFIIPFLAVYVHIYPLNILEITYTHWNLNFTFNLGILGTIFLLTIPPITCIANVMLANNICDKEDDLANKRYTLPIYIGKTKSLILYKWLYYIAYISIVVMCILKILPLISLSALLTFILVKKNINKFHLEQNKGTTFVFAVNNLMLINGILSLTIFIGFVLKLL